MENSKFSGIFSFSEHVMLITLKLETHHFVCYF